MLTDELKSKIQSAKDWSANILTPEERDIVYKVAIDINESREERIIAARTMLNISENNLKRAENQVKHFKGIWLGLEHQKAFDSEVTSMANKLGNVPGIEAVLEALLEQAKAKKNG